MDRLLVCLLLGLAVTEIFHNLFEIWGIRQKAAWLAARMDNAKHGKWPINIDTKLKTIIVHAVLFVLITGLVFAIALQLGLAIDMMLKAAIVVLLVSYALTTLLVDEYHTEMGKLLSRFRPSK